MGAEVQKPQAPKKSNPLKSSANNDQNSNNNGVPPDHERRKESSKAAQQALAARKRAEELRQAADRAADPQERQRLIKEATSKQAEAVSLGKTAKYLQSGAFQGLVAGVGIGSVPGLALGTITGTLVGGATTLVVGGLGGAVGAATGAIHGPFVNMGKIAGKGMNKVTGSLPGWKGTGDQRAMLERLAGQVNEQEAPSEADLTSMAEGEAQSQSDGQQSDGPGQSWTEHDAPFLPSSSEKPKGTETDTKSGEKMEHKSTQATPATQSGPVSSPRSRKPPRKLDRTVQSQQISSPQNRKTPRKLEIRKRDVQ